MSDNKPPGASKPSQDEAQRFIEQARWLLDFHDRRSESLTSRAVALLGFVGVILALIVGLGLPDDVDPSALMLTNYAVAVMLLLGTAGFCIAVLWTREQKMPGVAQLRSNWALWVTGERRGQVTVDVTESLLLAKDLSKESPLTSVINAADSRADSFRLAVVLMAMSLTATTLLLIQLGIEATQGS